MEDQNDIVREEVDYRDTSHAKPNIAPAILRAGDDAPVSRGPIAAQDQAVMS